MEEGGGEVEDDQNQERDNQQAKARQGGLLEEDGSIVRPPLLRRFRPTVSGVVACVAGLALLCGLGIWQVMRYHERQAQWEAFARGTDRLIELPRASTPPERYSHVRVRGRYLAERQVLLDNMAHDGESGYRVLTPLERVGAETVLVDRGWVPRRSSGRLPDLTPPPDEVTVLGRADRLPGRGVNLTDHPGPEWPKLMSYPTIDAVERVLGRPLYPEIVLLDPAEPGGFVRDWQPPGLPPAQHLGYAITWFSCAVVLLALSIRAAMRPLDASS